MTAERAAGADLMTAVRHAAERIDGIRAVEDADEFGMFVQEIITSPSGVKDSTILGLCVVCLNALDSQRYQEFLMRCEIDLPPEITPLPADQVRVGDEVRVAKRDGGEPSRLETVTAVERVGDMVTITMGVGEITTERNTQVFCLRRPDEVGERDGDQP